MEISSITFSNFRCFGADPTTIALSDIVVLIGENGAGKSAALMGLTRLFGLTSRQRTIQADDFFLPIGVSRDDPATKELALWIEARIVFPELAAGVQGDKAIPQHFKQMLVAEPGGDPFCRVRLRATWQRGNLPEGEVDQSLCWVAKPGEVSEAVEDEDCIRLTAFERQRIHVHYIPGARDPTQHVRVSSRSLLKRLLDAANWDDELKSRVESNVGQIADSFKNEDAI